MRDDAVFILIPVFNNQSGLTATVNSIIGDISSSPSQHVCLVIVDDGSDIPVFLPELNNDQILINLIRLDINSGIEAALNNGLDYCFSVGAKYLARIDCGDLVQSQRFVKQVQFLVSNQSCLVVGSWASAVDLSGNVIFTKTPSGNSLSVYKRMLRNSVLVHPSLMFDLHRTGYFNYSNSYPAAEDYELLRRVVPRNGFGVVEEVLCIFEDNPNGISAKRRRHQLISRLKIQIKYFSPAFVMSYIGLFQTVIFLVLPASFVARVKKFIVIS